MAVVTRTDAEVSAASDALDELYAQMPSNPRVAGARAAAEWTTGRAGTSPITNVREPAVEPRVGWEGHEANMVVVGLKPGNRTYAAGVMAWMFWWTGVESLPRWLRWPSLGLYVVGPAARACNGAGRGRCLERVIAGWDIFGSEVWCRISSVMRCLLALAVSGPLLGFPRCLHEGGKFGIVWSQRRDVVRRRGMPQLGLIVEDGPCGRTRAFVAEGKVELSDRTLRVLGLD